MNDVKFTIGINGGRVSGLYTEPGLNVLWSNPEGVHSEDDWPNPGGDRVWISPESELFFPDRSGWGRYKVPASVDPGHYSMSKGKNGSVTLKNEGEARMFGVGCGFAFRLVQEISPLEKPYCACVEGLAFAGYRKTVTLQVEGTFPETLCPAIWNLLQVPPGGSIFGECPAPWPQPFFGKGAWQRQGKFVEVPVPSPGESFKIGIPPEISTGRMLYVNETAPRPFLIMRRFNVAGKCCDAAFGHKDCVPCPQQFFSDNGSAGGFGEMEHHSTPVASDGGTITDVCTTEAFSGSIDAVREYAQRLMIQ